MARGLTCGLLAMGMMVAVGSTVFGITEFKKAFKEKYADPSSSEDFKAAVRKAGCFVCHEKGEEKDVRNAYGAELAKLIEGDVEQRLKNATDQGTRKDEIEKLLKELDAAFPQVEVIKDAAGETYGDRIKAGKLPLEAK
jgi:cytochrome c553